MKKFLAAVFLLISNYVVGQDHGAIMGDVYFENTGKPVAGAGISMLYNDTVNGESQPMSLNFRGDNCGAFNHWVKTGRYKLYSFLKSADSDSIYYSDTVNVEIKALQFINIKLHIPDTFQRFETVRICRRQHVPYIYDPPIVSYGVNITVYHRQAFQRLPYIPYLPSNTDIRR